MKTIVKKVKANIKEQLKKIKILNIFHLIQEKLSIINKKLLEIKLIQFLMIVKLNSRKFLECSSIDNKCSKILKSG